MWRYAVACPDPALNRATGRLRAPLPHVGHMEEPCGLPLRRLAAPVISSRGLHVGVPCHVLHSRDVGASIEHVTDEGHVG